MVLDIDESLTTYLWNLLTGDDTLKAAMGDTVRCYLRWANPDAEFPYLVHRIDIRKEPGTHVIQKATYYLDVWSYSPNATEILTIRKRLIGLLDELNFSTTEVGQAHIEHLSDGFVPGSEQGIWHRATMWDMIFRRDSEAATIEGR